MLSLAGRAAELQHLEEVLGGENARPIVITGEPGSGRTRLLEDLAARARRQGFAVALVRSRRAQPFGVAASLAAELCGVADGGRIDTVRAAIESARLPPADAGAALALTSASFMPPGFTPGHAAAALQALIRAALQQRPVLIGLDHADRADPESLEAIRLVVARRQPRCVVAASASSGVLGGEQDLLQLGPLAAADAEALAREILGGPPPRELLSRAAGNPRALIDLSLLWLEIAALPDLSPARLAAARVETSGPLGRRLLEAGAILGDPFDAFAAEAAVLDDKQKPGKVDPRAQLAWARLERTLVLRALPGRRYAFADGLVREAALARSDGATRAALHRRLAEAWKARVLDLGAAAAAEVGRHFSAAGDAAGAAQWWERAAEASLQRRDFRGAAARLVQHGGQAQLARASALLFAAGEVQAAREAADQALLAKGEPADACEAAISSARCFRQEGQREQATRALNSIPAGAGGPALVLARVEAGEQLEAAGNVAGARKRYEEALGQAQAVQHLARWHGEIDLRARVELRLGAILAAQGDGGSAAAAFEHARDAFEKAAHPWGAARALANMGALSAQAGRYPDAIQRYQAAAQSASAAGDLAFAVRQLASLAKVQRLSGDLARARATARDAEQLARDLAWEEGVKLAVGAAQV
jgi:tetratricopeptide (TPR) repeat protein